MTKEDIINMAHKAGGYTTERYPDEWRLDVDDLERFANLVAAAEREACAKVCDDIDEEFAERGRATWCSAAIRARGQG
jgi:hypothetical protein